jgi:hypothetical protein
MSVPDQSIYLKTADPFKKEQKAFIYWYVNNGIEIIKSMAEGGVIARKEAAFPRFAGGELDKFIDEANKLLESGKRTSIAQACEKVNQIKNSAATIKPDSMSAAIRSSSRTRMRYALRPFRNSSLKCRSSFPFKTSRPSFKPIAALSKKAGISNIPCGTTARKTIRPSSCANQPIKPPLRITEKSGKMPNSGPNMISRKQVKALFRNITTKKTIKISHAG